MSVNNQRLKQPGRASLRGVPKVIPKLAYPWHWVTKAAQTLGLAKVNSDAPLCAKRESDHSREVLAGLPARQPSKKRTKKCGKEK